MDAIIWSAVLPTKKDKDMLWEEGDVELHKELLKQQQAVYWDNSRRRNELKGPINGYIYIAGEGIVKYRCRVEKVISLETLRKEKEEQKFVPHFRKQCLNGKWPDGRPHGPSETWIKILKIEDLNPPSKISDFKKWNGEPLKKVRGAFAYVQDPYEV